VDAQDHNGMTPLLLASKDCAVTMAKLLLDRRAEPGIADTKGDRFGLLSCDIMHDFSFVGKTALHWAASVNNVDGIRLLVQSNANKDIQDQKVCYKFGTLNCFNLFYHSVGTKSSVFSSQRRTHRSC